MAKAKPVAFGIFDYSMFGKINRILKPHGIRLKKRTSTNWGDQVEITAERFVAVPPKPKRRYHFAIFSKFPEIGQTGCTWGENLADAQKNVDADDVLKRMPSKKCTVCKM